MATIDINGTTLHYERSGHGPAILFVHGAFGDADVWADQARRFEDRYTCVRYDRRGHSRSARGDAPIDSTLHAADAAALIDALDLAPCLLVGSSFGAAIGVEVALDHGRLLRGVVLSEPPLLTLDPEATEAAMSAIGPIIQQAAAPGGRRGATDAFMSCVCPGLWSAIDETTKDRYRANADIAFSDIVSPKRELTATDLATITIPALVIGGDGSPPFHRSISQALAAALPDARFVELAGSGHVTYYERPDEFAAAVAAFAAETDRRMSPPAEDRFEVRSADGTALAVWVDGSGPPLVLVHGTLTDHTGFAQLVDELRPDVTTFAVDRRGYGSTGDRGRYTIEQEFEDVAAVVDAVAARTGQPVALLGHSYGANCALGGATLSGNVSQLLVYEPSLGLDYPPGAIDAMDAALASGDREPVLLAALAPLELTDEQVDELRSGPRWPVLLAGAPMAPRECRAEQGWLDGYEAFAGIGAKTLFLSGDQTPPEVVKLTHEAAAAIPGSEIRVLEGHAHLAHRTDPALVATIIREFLAS